MSECMYLCMYALHIFDQWTFCSYQWHRNRGVRRFNELGPPSPYGPRIGAQKILDKKIICLLLKNQQQTTKCVNVVIFDIRCKGLCTNGWGWADRDAVWGGRLVGAPRHIVLEGGEYRDPPWLRALPDAPACSQHFGLPASALVAEATEGRQVTVEPGPLWALLCHWLLYNTHNVLLLHAYL